MATIKYHSANRDTILSLAKSYDTPFTVKDLEEKLDAQNKHLGVSTIYRILDEYESIGLVKKSLGENNTANYRYIEPCEADNHCYLECISCHKIHHLDCKQINSLSKHLNKEHDFKLITSNLTIKGLCSNCKRLDEKQD